MLANRWRGPATSILEVQVAATQWIQPRPRLSRFPSRKFPYPHSSFEQHCSTLRSSPCTREPLPAPQRRCHSEPAFNTLHPLELGASTPFHHDPSQQPQHLLPRLSIPLLHLFPARAHAAAGMRSADKITPRALPTASLRKPALGPLFFNDSE